MVVSGEHPVAPARFAKHALLYVIPFEEQVTGSKPAGHAEHALFCGTVVVVAVVVGGGGVVAVVVSVVVVVVAVVVTVVVVHP
jgi:hypothetical protein